MAPRAMSPGTVLGGRYRLDDLLADHDGARFWRATDTVLARSVAVHAISSEDARAERVLDAARLSATVTDQHFLRVLDCDDDGRLAWVINEWGSGVSLDLMLQQGTLPPSRAAWLVREVAEAVAAAHSQGVHHGRLNPEAVLVTEAGSVKVIGFVTNRAFEGRSLVSPVYGELDDREADVIDLAGILYAALVGKWPGVAPSAVPPAPREGGRPLRPRQVRAGVPRTLDAICERVLLKEGSRHALPIESAHEVAAALSDFVGDPAAAAPLDVSSMHAEPTVVIPRGLKDDVDLSDLGRTGTPEKPADTDATVVSPPARRDSDPGPATPPPPAPPTPATSEPEPTAVEPFAQPDDRPLFADHERRVPPGAPPPPPPAVPSRDRTSGGTAGTSGGHDTGTGTGTGEGYWPFEPHDDTGNFSGDEGRGWLRLAGIVAVVIALLAGMFFAFDAGRGDQPTDAGPQGTDTSRTPIGAELSIAGASDFDPEGDPPVENPEEAPLAIDAKPDTGWPTQTYTRANSGGLKSGVGLLVDLGSEREVGSLSIDFAGGPTEFELYATETGVDDAPAELADLRQVAPAMNAGENIVVRPSEQLTTRFLVVWITTMPPVGDGFRGEITEVTVHS